jgi:hypothetical protein
VKMILGLEIATSKQRYYELRQLPREMAREAMEGPSSPKCNGRPTLPVPWQMAHLPQEKSAMGESRMTQSPGEEYIEAAVLYRLEISRLPTVTGSRPLEKSQYITTRAGFPDKPYQATSRDMLGLPWERLLQSTTKLTILVAVERSINPDTIVALIQNHSRITGLKIPKYNLVDLKLYDRTLFGVAPSFCDIGPMQIIGMVELRYLSLCLLQSVNWASLANEASLQSDDSQ